MYRNMEITLKNWKADEHHKPLVIIGARQVGKTYSVNAFGKENYSDMITLNFQDDISAREYFSVPRSADEILTYIEINFPNYTNSKETLIFFDEVQLCPEVLTALKYLTAKVLCDFVCSGSMLGVQLHKTSSWPVGYVQLLAMHPMSFIEFALAAGIDKKYIETVEKCIEEITPVPDAVHNRFLQLFRDYMICGGMPEAVSEYVSNGVAAAVRVNRRLSNDYRVDIAHYADGKTKIKAQECFDSIPAQLAKENRKFQYGVVKKGYNARYYDESLTWLESSGLVIKTNRLAHIDLPLKAQRELGIFKIYLFDTGVLAGQFSDADISAFMQDSLGTYKGMLYENVTAVLLHGMGFTSYYYEPNTSSEIDFIIEGADGIVPIEVKGGLHTKSKAFDNFIKNHSSKKAYRFSQKNIGLGSDGVVRFMPIYTLELCLKQLSVS